VPCPALIMSVLSLRYISAPTVLYSMADLQMCFAGVQALVAYSHVGALGSVSLISYRHSYDSASSTVPISRCVSWNVSVLIRSGDVNHLSLDQHPAQRTLNPRHGITESNGAPSPVAPDKIINTSIAHDLHAVVMFTGRRGRSKIQYFVFFMFPPVFMPLTPVQRRTFCFQHTSHLYTQDISVPSACCS